MFQKEYQSRPFAAILRRHVSVRCLWISRGDSLNGMIHTNRITVIVVFILVGAAASADDGGTTSAPGGLLGGPGSCTTDTEWAQVVDVRASRSSRDWTFSVTVRHADTGWDHYADEWQVVDPVTGEVYGTRVLTHPHVEEQPFTRSQSGIAIPDGVREVLVRAKCTVHGWGGCGMIVALER